MGVDQYHALDNFNRNAAYFGIATSAFLTDWYGPFSEPVREIAPELTGHGLPLSKCEGYNRVYDQFYRWR